MVAEPASLCWLSGRQTAQRDGATWAEELRKYAELDYVVSDAGSGLLKGVREVQAQRPRVQQGLDVFHTLREGGKALRRMYGAATRALVWAERGQKRLEKRARQGQAQSGWAGAVKRRWRKAERALEAAAAAERAWNECKTALELFRAEGQLNERAQAEAVVARCLPELSDPVWAKVRRLLQRPEAFTFLDRLQAAWATLPVDADTRRALVQQEWTRRQLAQTPPESAEAARLRALHLARTVQLAKTRPDGQELTQTFRDLLRSAWRASSLIEGINSVARMQQARHRKMTQGLLDLKRLYWNLRRFRTGRRRGHTPYELLGLRLPTTHWWQLLKRPLTELRQELSG